MTWKARTIDDGAGGSLVLREDAERGGVVELVAGNVVLLSSAALETERAFGRLALDWKPPRVDGPLRVLVGGLGFGATVRGVVDAASEVGIDVRVVVVEKVAAVERLVRGELAAVAGRPLDDGRVEAIVGDVGDVLARSEARFDVVLLDVDNGPGWASFRTNARLYTDAGVEAAAQALRPGGALAVWSGYPADRFLAVLRGAGLAPSLVPLHERGRVRARAYVGRKA